MPAELLTGTRPSFPVDMDMLSWAGLPWEDGCTTDELIALRLRQLERRKVELERAKERLEKEREKGKGDERKLLPRWFRPYVVDETRYLGTQIRLFRCQTGEMRTEPTPLEAELSEEDELGRDEEETDLHSRMHD
ncbi:MAG: hypothetical protein BJ554DRAFT_5012 [Olpidium bornovanus]|uniref:Uncharacterized protein n=1 Tax=Olpidium bornovanus TaxID=278681 RepID=A0A8H8DEC0_9FUNG|nr:MAG: hypothetical protein BJ554DRAFT_5012 [Olpidium bornovanus]